MGKISVSKLDLTIFFVEDPNIGGFTAYFGEYPEVIAEGKTKEEATENLTEAFLVFLKYAKPTLKYTEIEL